MREKILKANYFLSEVTSTILNNVKTDFFFTYTRNVLKIKQVQNIKESI